MKMLIRIAFALAILLSADSALAQSSSADNQSKQPQCRLFPPLNKKVKVTLKDGRKFKGKLKALDNGDFQITYGNKTETLICADIVQVDKTYRFGRGTKLVAGGTLLVAGLILCIPGAIIALSGAREVGKVIGTPGIAVALVGAYVLGDDLPVPIMMWP